MELKPFAPALFLALSSVAFASPIVTDITSSGSPFPQAIPGDVIFTSDRGASFTVAAGVLAGGSVSITETVFFSAPGADHLLVRMFSDFDVVGATMNRSITFNDGSASTALSMNGGTILPGSDQFSFTVSLAFSAPNSPWSSAGGSSTLTIHAADSRGIYVPISLYDPTVVSASDVAPVPEPATFGLCGCLFVGLGIWKVRNRTVAN